MKMWSPKTANTLRTTEAITITEIILGNDDTIVDTAILTPFKCLLYDKGTNNLNTLTLNIPCTILSTAVFSTFV